MKKEELTALKAITDIKELDAKLKEKKSELLSLRFQLAIGQLENTAAIKECKKDIARIETIKRQLELGRTAKA